MEDKGGDLKDKGVEYGEIKLLWRERGGDG